ncbi:unnamed protein product, partial [Prorocentrum cordatum]
EAPAPTPAPAVPAPAAQPATSELEDRAAQGGAAERQPALAAATPDGEDHPRPSRAPLKLSSDAPIFVPSFMPAPPAPPAAPAGAAEFDAGADTMMRTSLRTRLAASAKPFEPQFNVTFDPAQHTWTVDAPEEEGGGSDGTGQGNRGKGE